MGFTYRNVMAKPMEAALPQEEETVVLSLELHRSDVVGHCGMTRKDIIGFLDVRPRPDLFERRLNQLRNSTKAYDLDIHVIEQFVVGADSPDNEKGKGAKVVLKAEKINGVWQKTVDKT